MAMVSLAMWTGSILLATAHRRQEMKFNGYPFWHPFSGLKGGLITGAIIAALIVGFMLLVIS